MLKGELESERFQGGGGYGGRRIAGPSQEEGTQTVGLNATKKVTRLVIRFGGLVQDSGSAGRWRTHLRVDYM